MIANRLAVKVGVWVLLVLAGIIPYIVLLVWCAALTLREITWEASNLATMVVITFTYNIIFRIAYKKLTAYLKEEAKKSI